jgi:hypothetical protein
VWLRHRRLLRARRERPRGRSAAKKGYELTALQLIELHFIPASQGQVAGYRIGEGASSPRHGETESFDIHLRGFFSSITAQVAAAVIPPSATSSKTSSGVPIGVISRLAPTRPWSSQASTITIEARPRAFGRPFKWTLDSPPDRVSLITRRTLYSSMWNTCLDDGHRGHHHEVAGAVDAVKLVHFSKFRWPRFGFVGGAGAWQPMECSTH